MNLREILSQSQINNNDTNDLLKQIKELENIINDTKIKLTNLRQNLVLEIGCIYSAKTKLLYITSLNNTTNILIDNIQNDNINKMVTFIYIGCDNIINICTESYSIVQKSIISKISQEKYLDIRKKLCMTQ